MDSNCYGETAGHFGDVVGLPTKLRRRFHLRSEPLIRAVAVRFPDLARRLEQELQSQLTLPGPDGRIADHAEVGIADIGVWRTEYGMIEGVLRLQTHFEFQLFVAGGQCEVLQDG